MKKTKFFLLTFLLISSSIFSQESENKKYDNEVKILFTQIINEIGIGTDEKLIINSKPSNISECKTVIKSNGFTNVENKFIDENIKKPIVNKWTEIYFDKAIIVKKSEIDIAYKNNQNELQEFADKYGNTILEFSSPIFLQNYSICILNYSRSYTFGGGYENSAVYKKENGTWKKFGVSCRATKS